MLVSLAGGHMSEINLPILSPVRALPLAWINQWRNLRARVVMGAQGTALANQFYL
jgi:hypothetical protein